MRSAWHWFLALAAAHQASSQELVDPTSKDNGPDCDCFVASGPDLGFFQYHRFWDFRSIPGDSDSYTSAPALITTGQANGTEPFTSSYLNTTKFRADWGIVGDVEREGSPFRNVNSPQNVYISRNTTDGANGSTYLTLRTARLPDFMSTAELDSRQNNILHGSFRSRFRVIPNDLGNSSAPKAGATELNDENTGSSVQKPVDDGAVVGFFPYYNDTAETDIEILTTEPSKFIHYTNQPDYDANADKPVPDATNNMSLPDGLAYTDWIEHRIDWFDGVTRYYVNDKLVLNKTKNVPTVPMGLIFNVWGDGGSWSGNMSVGGQVAMAIEWVEMIFNVSGPTGPKTSAKRDQVDLDLTRRVPGKCQAACKVDNLKSVGFPEKTSLDSPAQTGSAQPSQTSGSLSGSGSTSGSSSSPSSTQSAGSSISRKSRNVMVVLLGMLAVAAPTKIFI